MEYAELRRTLEREALIAEDTGGRETVDPALVLDLLARTRPMLPLLDEAAKLFRTGDELAFRIEAALLAAEDPT